MSNLNFNHLVGKQVSAWKRSPTGGAEDLWAKINTTSKVWDK